MKTQSASPLSTKPKQYLRADGTPLFDKKIAKIKEVITKYGLPDTPKD
ncbi:MAG: hypothetical protein MUE30_17305 [Spirosomaceae bacterium]|jgi:hypothetical protein|nr:hypothetical protein [Spirosomataceae bacterium]